MNRRTTIFFATDVHGSERCFIKFINAAKFYQANVLILGGDITGKALVPIVRQACSTNYTANFLGQAATLESEEAIAAFERQVRQAGAYPFRTTRDELAAMESDRSLVHRPFTRLMAESVERWCTIAEDPPLGNGVRWYLSAGTDYER